MRILIALALVVALLVAWYAFAPRVQQQTDRYMEDTIRWIAQASERPAGDRSDSLLVLSLSLRQNGRVDVAKLALEQADSLSPEEPLIKGLLGLYAMEEGQPGRAIEHWHSGMLADSTNANLAYLAGLDTTELEYLDNHMIERMFVDSLSNSRLQTALYHAADTRVVDVTERKIRINSSLNYTFYTLAGLALMLFVRKRTKKPRPETASSSAEDTRGASGTMTLAGLAAGLLKIAQILAACYGTIKLGKDVTSFVSDYILTPYRLIDLLTSNALFASIFSLLVVAKVASPPKPGSASKGK